MLMKKSILLTLSAGILYFTLSSYSNGPSIIGPQTAVNGCGGSGGCHGSSINTSTVPSITIKEKITGTVITNGEYTPGMAYTVTVSATNSNASEFGYIARIANAASTQAGILSNATSGSKIQSSGGFSVAEHSAPITASGQSFSASFDWTAPAVGAGDVTINLAVNGVNGDNSASSADQFNTTSLKLNEGPPVSISAIASEITVETFPNPFRDFINIKLVDIHDTYKLRVVNMHGQTIHSNIIPSTTAVQQINTTNWADGIYFVQLSDGARDMNFQIVKE